QSNSTLNGGDAELFTCNGGKNQQWSILPDGELMNVNSGKCLTDNGNSTTLGTQLVQEDCARQTGQVWEPAP
ncbi:MAG: ricin-type beta-trefoil lectin domain protein, partial [Streptosporangiales bacterium]|nr:ricin-type beta-trefoil lectin domain protein [Streptosporangiales bacterium]